MKCLELLTNSGRDYSRRRNFIVNSLKITGLLTLVIGVQLINIPVCLTPETSHPQQAMNTRDYTPPDSGGPKISVASGTR